MVRSMWCANRGTLRLGVIFTRFTSIFLRGYENLDFSLHPFLRHLVIGRREKLTSSYSSVSWLRTLFYADTLLRFTIIEKVIEMFLIIFMAISDLLNVLCAI